MNVFEKLIFKPTLQPQVQRTLFSAATLLAWTLYLYFWVPAITLAMWLAGLRTSYLQLYLQKNVVNLALLGQLFGIALICALILIGWAEYNRARFQGLDRRARQPDATDDEVADALRASRDDTTALRSARVATITMDNDATPTSVTVSATILKHIEPASIMAATIAPATNQPA